MVAAWLSSSCTLASFALLSHLQACTPLRGRGLHQATGSLETRYCLAQSLLQGFEVLVPPPQAGLWHSWVGLLWRLVYKLRSMASFCFGEDYQSSDCLRCRDIWSRSVWQHWITWIDFHGCSTMWTEAALLLSCPAHMSGLKSYAEADFCASVGFCLFVCDFCLFFNQVPGIYYSWYQRSCYET